MNDKAFIIESMTKRGRTHQNITSTLPEALQFAMCFLHCWIDLDGFDKEAAKQITDLLAEGKTAAAIDLWNERSEVRHIAIHEIEFSKRNCHREPLEAGDGIRYAVDITYDGVPEYNLYLTQDQALGFVSLMLSRLPAKKQIRRKVRRLLREGKRVEAIDAWNEGNIDPTFAIHQVKLVKARCHHDS
jgi:hypothetical protein